jgi:hypothetical protein
MTQYFVLQRLEAECCEKRQAQNISQRVPQMGATTREEYLPTKATRW